MKVCTDACLFGAIIAETILSEKLKANDVLDIGTGTGLLSLMVCQRTNNHIDAVEIEAAAPKQAAANVEASPFHDKIRVLHQDILQYQPDKSYDIILSNPPFFEEDLKSPDSKINKARHDSSLTLHQLTAKAVALLSDTGYFAVLLPFHRINYSEKTASENNLFLTHRFLIKQTPKHPYFRGILFFSKQATDCKTKEIVIKDETGLYSDEFLFLLKDYYL